MGPKNFKTGSTSTRSTWKIRNQSRHFSDIIDKIKALLLPNPDAGHDIFKRRDSAGEFRDTFSSSRTWAKLCLVRVKVDWFRLIWFSHGVPRFAFISWLAVKNRFSTCDGMRLWVQEQSCTLYGEMNKTRDHIFFACPYSFTVWLAIARNFIGTAGTPDWDDTLTYLTTALHNKMDSILLGVCFHTTIYHLWGKET